MFLGAEMRRSNIEAYGRVRNESTSGAYIEMAMNAKTSDATIAATDPIACTSAGHTGGVG
jgi:hypothetical protein